MASGWPLRGPRSWSRWANSASTAGGCQSSAMCHRHHGQCEGTGSDAGQIDGDRTEPGRPHRVEQRRPHGFAHRATQLIDRKLDPRRLAMVTDPAVGEAEPAYCLLGLLDLPELPRSYLLEVRDPRG